MFNIYRYCRITGVDVRLTVCPDQTGPSAIEMAMARLPASEAVNPTPGFLQTVRGSVYCLTPSAGAPAKTITQSYASFDELGNPVYDRSLWQNETKAASTTLDGDEPVVAVAVRSINGQAAVVAINLQVTYHMEWFDLEADDAALEIVGRDRPQNGICNHSRPRDHQSDQGFSVCSMSEKVPPRRK